ncbi:MAG: hypothetical protein JWM82_68, partial [Myxococcales bacterium]|nr:hypothetical protein [Myxococcales bacterium]
MGDNPQDFLDRLFDATNAHDL